MGMFFFIPVFYFSHIPPASFIKMDGYFYTSPNQKDDPSTLNVTTIVACIWYCIVSTLAYRLHHRLSIFVALFLLLSGYVFFLIPVFYFSHIPQASFLNSKWTVIYTRLLIRKTILLNVSYSELLPNDAPPSQLRKRVWALQFFPMTSRFTTPLEQISLVDGKRGYQLPEDVGKSWKTLKPSCCQVTFVLHSLYEVGHPKVVLNCSVLPKPNVALTVACIWWYSNVPGRFPPVNDV